MGKLSKISVSQQTNDVFSRGNFDTRAVHMIDPSLDPSQINLDRYVGATWDGKPVLDLNGVREHIDSGYSQNVGSDNIITYTFAASSHITGKYNNPNYGLPDSGNGFTRFSPAQQDAGRAAIQLWDDLVPQHFVEQKGLGNADITLANSNDPAQAYALYPYFEQPGNNYPGDVFTHNPAGNWTNEWFQLGGYGNTTLIHELGHTLGLSHPGSYNYDPNLDLTYANYAEYAQDSTQYTIMSYWDSAETGSYNIDWNTFFYGNAQTPMLHDIYVIQQKYGADLETRATDTTYGFHSNAGNIVYDFAQNEYPFLAVYDAGGIDTLDLSGFNGSNFIDLHAGSFSSVGQGIPTAEDVNAHRAELDTIVPGTLANISQASINDTILSYMVYNENEIFAQTGVHGIYATEHDNLAIAYGTTIENAIGGGAADLIYGNQVGNMLDGGAGNDTLLGFEGNDSLVGGEGNDRLIGDAGNDSLLGGTGNDTLTGGAGADTFKFAGLEIGDVITDFNHGQGDVIDLSGLGTGTQTFIGGSAFSGHAGEVNYVGNVLSADTDGNGVADFSVALTGMPEVHADALVLHA